MQFQPSTDTSLPAIVFNFTHRRNPASAGTDSLRTIHHLIVNKIATVSWIQAMLDPYIGTANTELLSGFVLADIQSLT